MEYDQATDKVTASGHVSVTDTRGNVVFADHVVLTDHMRDGALQGFGALLGKTGRLAATSAQRVNGTMLVAHQHRLQPVQDLQAAGPAHALMAGQGRARGL